jgi:TRAP-type C4-dicarboxylate transport system substrate-binding protein
MTFVRFSATCVAAATAVAIALPANAVTELKVSTALGSKHDQSTAFFETFLDKMKEDESLVKLNYIGGPEVTQNRKQGPAMKRGLIDIIMSPATYYAPLVPEARLMGISNIEPEVWRRNGGYDLMAKAWAKRLNGIILGWGNHYGFNQFFIWLVNKPKLSKKTGIDLTGLKMRTTPLYTPFLKAMGATPKAISPSEVYTALERGVVAGLAWPEGGVAFRGWQSRIKYRVYPGFFRSSTMVTMNLDAFNKLPRKAQDQLRAAGMRYEKESGALLKAKAIVDNAKVFKAGVQKFELKGEYAKAYIRTILEANWADAAKRKFSSDFETLKSKMVAPGS